MKVKSPLEKLEGNCPHGIPQKEYCKKCFDKKARKVTKETEKFLKALDKFEKESKKTKLNIMFKRLNKMRV